MSCSKHTKEEVQAVWNSLWKKEHKQETRCRHCHAREACQAFDTGVIYPCPYFEKEADNGTEE